LKSCESCKARSASKRFFIQLASAASPTGVEVAWQLKQSISEGVSFASTRASYIAAMRPTPVFVGLKA
jgi:hypothetical protein